MSDQVTELDARARGWLRHLWEKATTPDDWSSSGEPHPWWDRDSSGPMCAFPRFDLGESAYALPLMCEVTPAWREVYARIAREFCERHMTFWAAIDALVLIGEDPNVDRYPPEWQIYIPERLRGAYAPPGWIGNGDQRWADFAERHYMGRDRRGDLEWFAFYYDPIEREAMTFPDNVTALAALVTLPYICPQRPEWGQWLYEQSVAKLGWSNPKARINTFVPDPRTTSIALLMAHELGDDVTETRMRAYVEERSEPRTFGDEDDRFGFFFGWGEPYPRGQHSALLMVPEVGGRGAWSRWSNDANLAKFDAPTVEGVDYPSLGLSVARNDVGAGELLIGTYAATPSHAGRATSLRVVQLPDVDAVRATCDGEEFTAWRPAGPGAIELDLRVGDHTVVVWTGYHGRASEVAREYATSAPAGAVSGSPVVPSPVAIAAAASCRCC